MRTRLETTGEIAWLTMDDGKVNALGEDLLRELGERLAETRERARVTVLQGRAGIFSAGFDLGAFSRGPEAATAMMRAGVEILDQILTHPHPIVTGCTGHAYPMGAFLMMCADRRLGIPGPFRIGMNEVAIGIHVPRFALAVARHRLTPPAFARISTGTLCAPVEAVAAGYLDEVVPEDELTARLRATAESLLAIESRVYVRTKERLNADLLRDLRAAGTWEVLSEEVEAAAAAA